MTARLPEHSSKCVLNAMTVDVEDYFHVSVFDGVLPRQEWQDLESRVCANTDRLLALFDEAGVSATFFVLGWVAERFPALVRRIADQGHEVASHGHEHRLVYDQTPRAFRADVGRAKRLLEDLTGMPVLGFRAPSYSITPRSLWALDVLIEEGHVYDTSIFPIHHDRYGIPTLRAVRLRGEPQWWQPDRSAGLHDSRRRVEPSGVRRRVLPAAPVRVDAMGALRV